MTKKTRRDIHQDVTDTIIAALESGTKPWIRSWRSAGGAGAALRHNGTPYTGINTVILWAAMRSNPFWMTFNQAAEYAGLKKDGKRWAWEDGKGVRKGETSTSIVFYKALKIKDKLTGEDKVIPLLRSYNVFNVEQIDGLPERFYPKPATEDASGAMERDPGAEAFIAATGANITHGGGRAFYRPSTDAVYLPKRRDFDSPDAYYATAFHELGHWTGAEKRLDRKLLNGFGTKDYAKEELIAELTAAFTCATLGINDSPRDDHAQYLAEWLKRLGDDKTFVFKAAAAAQKAANYLAATTEVKLEEAA